MNPNTGAVTSLEDIFGRAILTSEDQITAERMARDGGLVVVGEQVAAAVAVGMRPSNRAERRAEQRRLRQESRKRYTP